MLKARPQTRDDLAYFKRRIAKKLHLETPSNISLLKAYHELAKNQKMEWLLRKRKIRSLSGIVTISVLTKPYPCPGKCLYCPTEKGMPKSYLSNEPAVMRAILNQFNPKKQIENRLESLKLQGHPTDKIELIIIGGTWSYLPRSYRAWFIMKCFRACNRFPVSQIPNFQSPISNQFSKSKLQKPKLLEEQKKNEKAKHRIVGITIETRPDFIDEKEILFLRKLGVTRVELGVQSIYDDVLKFNLRGHLVKETVKATKLLKDAGFKICYHIIPNLPGSDLRRDKKTFKELFSSPDFQPDLLKIYPCAILKEAPLYRLWKKGDYKPYTENQMINLLLRIKKQIPYYCRIQRLIRDIPSPSIVAGPAKISNMRQVLAKAAKKENWHCKCIRCREARENYNPKEKLYLFRQDYKASGGKEIFLSYENKSRDRLYSLLRLRIPFAGPYAEETKLGETWFPPIWTHSDGRIRISRVPPQRGERALFGCAIIRELHTYGQLRPLNGREQFSAASPQHKGLGKKLIKEAERIARKGFKINKIAVISGIGVRDYYRKLGYKLQNTYMIKNLDPT